MGRPLTLALLAPVLAAAIPTATEAVSGVDVLTRCQSLVAQLPASAPAESPTFLPIAAANLPDEVTVALKNHSITWSALSDVMRTGVLWAHGYVVPSGGDGTSLAKIYTTCDPKTPDEAATATVESQFGLFMDEIGLLKTQFSDAQCELNTCGNFYQTTNDKCAATITQSVQCMVDAKNLPTSNASFGADAGTDSTNIPYPQLYVHTVAVTEAATTSNATTKSVNLASIHMQKDTTGTTTCGNTGDAIVPCVPLGDVAPTTTADGPPYCRPKVDGVRLKAFFDVVKKHLEDTATFTAKQAKASKDGSGGLSTGALAGIIGGAVVVLGLVAFYFFRSKKNKKKASNDRGVEVLGRKSPASGTGRSGPNAATGFNAHRPGKGFQRQGTSNTFAVMDQRDDNDTVFSTDYVEGQNHLDEGSRQRRFSQRLLESMESVTGRTRNSSLTTSFKGFGKSVEEYCEESEVIRDFVNNPQIKIRRIPYEELTVLRILSKGSYGEVFLGQLETRHIAMKRLLPEKKHLTKSIEQFMGEIQIMCNLEHRNIVTFVGVSWDYLQNISVVVEYMDNGDLSEVLVKSKNKYTWPKEKISISMDIAEGLVYLHSMRPVIVHRDLKSKNVLLNKRGQAKLSDFGVSRKTNVNETMTSGVGTLLWTAPEIIEGRKYSEKADIFSLGVVLSEIDTCEEPYSTVKNEETGERLPGMQIVQMVRLGQLRVNFRADCPPKLRELAEQCTDLDPDKRPTSMEVAYTLKSIIAPSLRAGSSS